MAGLGAHIQGEIASIMTTVNEPPPKTWDVGGLLARLDRHLDAAASSPPVTAPDGYRTDPKGRLVPPDLVSPSDLLQDDTARRIAAFALDLADQIARFRAHTYNDLAALLELLANEYGVRVRGRKGNYSVRSHDGRIKVAVQVADRVHYGPELQVARELVDECVSEWSSDARPEIRALVQHAFEPDREGKVHHEAVCRLRRLDIDDDRWRQARQAIDDSIRVIGSRAYLRVHFRGGPNDPWKPIPIDISSDWTDTSELDEEHMPRVQG